MEINELVTVVIPTYNGEKYINKMLNSIYRQSYRPIQLIISDDNSRDNTFMLIKKWILSHNNNENFKILLVSNKVNKGLSDNINSMIKFIEGTYIFFADQDDIWIDNKVQIQVDFLRKNNNYIMVQCDRSIISNKGKILCNSEFEYIGYKPRKISYNDLLNKRSIYSFNCIAMRNENLENIFPIPKNIIEQDFYLLLMCIHFGDIGYINYPLVKYRIHPNNLSGNYFVETSRSICSCFRGYLYLFKRLRAIMDNDVPKLKECLNEKFGEKYNKNFIFSNQDTSKWIIIKALKQTFLQFVQNNIGSFNR